MIGELGTSLETTTIENIEMSSSTSKKCSSSARCAIAGCYSTARAKKSRGLSFHRFPVANERFVYRPGDVPGKVEKTDMREVWKTVTGVEISNSKTTRICSLHFLSSDYLYGDTEPATRRTLKKSAIPSRNLPGQSETIHEPAISLVGEENTWKPLENNYESEEPDEIVQEANCTNRVCMLSECIKSEKDLQIATGIESFEILNAIVNMIGKTFAKEYGIITPRNRIIMTYVKLKQNLDYSFLNMLFKCGGAEQCEQIFHSTLQVLSECFRTLIALPLYEEMSESWPVYFSEIKIVLDCIDIYMQGHDSCYKVIIGSSLGGIISYVSEPYKGDECDADIFRESSLTELLRPGDGVMVDREFSLEEVCRINEWKCVKPKTLREQEYLSRFNERIKNFGIVKSIIPDRIMPVVEEIFTVICGTMNMSALLETAAVVEID